MSNSDFKDQAEKYKQEMMKLYGGSTFQKQTLPSVDEQSIPTETPIKTQTEVIQQPTETEAVSEEGAFKEMNKPDAVEQRFPIPEIPDFIRENKPPNDSFGYLKVSVKTGNGGIPLENSLVTISEVIDGREHAVRMLTTDSSGSTETIRLPAPVNIEDNTPQSYENFSKYNISVYSEGYFRETSVDAPIFAGITSVQTFYLIPEPFDYNSGEQNIVDRNPEPIF